MIGHQIYSSYYSTISCSSQCYTTGVIKTGMYCSDCRIVVKYHLLLIGKSGDIGFFSAISGPLPYVNKMW